MAREVESVHTFSQERKYRLDKEVTIVRCDDSTVYEFEDVDGAPDSQPPRIRKAIQPDGSFTHTGSRKILPSAVEETLDTLFGGWSK